MRKDLNKVLCEHERWGSKMGFREVRKRPTGKMREGMKARYGWNTKEFGENLSALYGWLNKQVGRNWDFVYSEICQNFDPRKVINLHILQHLFMYVETKTIIGKDGKVYVSPQYGQERPIEEARGYTKLYVHPVTNLLCKANGKSWKQYHKDRRAKEVAEKRKTERQLEPNLKAVKENDTWFLVQTVPSTTEIRVYELGKYRTRLIATTREIKRTASKKQIKQHGLDKE